MPLPTEPIGSIPRPRELQEGMQAAAEGRLDDASLEALFDDAVRDTLRRFEATRSPGRTAGGQRTPRPATARGPPPALAPPCGGDRLDARHGRRAAQAELRDVPGLRPPPGSGRRHDPVRR